ncbi:hypothetical protein Kfla_4527 [Kribbella flavida DSM 17836]|uniref:Uncharacterized protein n=1 Tax=Kribbella flavida (strain DSM 17836 / JCM 10339 / NBRC 14399) TaxID=479435 RepID=D2PWT5_KRIFD|nr:hypothetical protein [Kribbella flavida]ADB33554.1 hypothetical protein Kfla_4527 [Kribbella flavida DSM 17836]
MSTYEELTKLAGDVHECVQALMHGTFRTTPAPLVYALTGNLKVASWGLAQLSEQLGSGLRRSLTEYEVYDNNREPGQSVDQAGAELQRAADLARQLAAAFEKAQTAINQQGHNGKKGR